MGNRVFFGNTLVNIQFDGVEFNSIVNFVAGSILQTCDTEKCKLVESRVQPGKQYVLCSKDKSAFDHHADKYNCWAEGVAFNNTLHSMVQFLYDLVQTSVLDQNVHAWHLMLRGKTRDGDSAVEIVTRALDRYDVFTEELKLLGCNLDSTNFGDYNEDFLKLCGVH